ncbi:LPXTG-site transpeptidase (sortase) family protein [Aneurinibacillus soli]|uniref:Sortase family protein n=1 Tax=Aneurinibacillus soli TaxID=1500254 RepID=A0A0U4NA95_9BACL|nr:class F sortase [Aneurinibacillus soli]PYE58964.1 LPXTG-site transpeptidase (sortase) family protein [Aneurinibacillus soli]BAU26020.1 Sortase family protein [Aneurinibacillus soli]
MRILICLLLATFFFFPCSTVDAHTSKAFIPVRIEIPQIKLKAAVEPVPVLANGQMGVPTSFEKVGVLMPWTNPGEPGNAVIAGHFDHYTGPAVFYHLRKLKRGDKIFLYNRKNDKLVFIVKDVESFMTKKAPLKRIFGPSSTAQLNLITCSGKFNKKTHEHAQRLVVFAEISP